MRVGWAKRGCACWVREVEGVPVGVLLSEEARDTVGVPAGVDLEGAGALPVREWPFAVLDVEAVADGLAGCAGTGLRWLLGICLGWDARGFLSCCGGCGAETLRLTLATLCCCCCNKTEALVDGWGRGGGGASWLGFALLFEFEGVSCVGVVACRLFRLALRGCRLAAVLLRPLLGKAIDELAKEVLGLWFGV
jgi:hypothetical protein